MKKSSFWTKLKCLHPRELWLLLKISALVVALPVFQRIFTLPRLIRLLDSKPSRKTTSTEERSRLIRRTRQMLNLNFGLFRPNCMRQSLVLFHLLRRAGDPVKIHFGVTKSEDELSSHCWLGIEEEPILEKVDPLSKFRVIYSFP